MSRKTNDNKTNDDKTKDYMTNLRNPFIFGAPVSPEDFYGREESIHFMMDRLYGRSRSSVALWGDRRVGKSSLLYYLMQPSLRQQWVEQQHLNKHHMVFIDCQIFATRFDPQQFWHEVLEHIVDYLIDDELHTYVDTLLDQETLSERDLRRFLRKLHRTGGSLTLLLDEFSHIVWAGRLNDSPEVQGFLAFLRTAITAVMPSPTSPFPRPLALVTSTRRPLHEVCRPLYKGDTGSPFYNPFVSERLSPFAEEEVHELLSTKLADTPITFSPNERAHLLQTAGRHPLLVQSYASEMFMAERKAPVEISDFTAIDSQFYDRTVPHFQDFWHYSSDEEKQFISILVADKLDWKELASHEERAQNQLIDRGLLLANNKLFSPLFYEWLRLNLARLEQEQMQDKSLPDASLLLVVIDEYFNDQEFRELIFDLGGISYDNLPADGKRDKARELISWCQRNGRLAQLVTLIQEKRPHLQIE